MRASARLTDGTGVLLCDGREVAALEILASRRARYRGLLGRDDLDGAVLLAKTNGVHTFGMRFPIDVAYLSRDLRVIAVAHMPRNRLGRNRLTARHTLEAAAGSLAAWSIAKGSRLAIGHAAPPT
ncbi:MAG TPA: DUF192 domain-containing protein [Streptosporangiaceae bacterium]